MILLTTKRVRLRRFLKTDLSSLRQMMSNPNVMKFTGFKTPQSEEKIQECLAKWTKPAIPQLGVWAACLLETDELFGWFMLTPTINEHSPEIGFMLREEFWGQGLTSEVSAALISYGFDQLNLKRIIASTHVNNHSSICILKKLGMSRFDYDQAAPEILYFEKKN